ncbi:MAG: glycosyltransferase family 39 protein, partial [Anaerolineae bacterium]|nr:glycosyltransferase family 39 protein [Anaerolineae bacterium]
MNASKRRILWWAAICLLFLTALTLRTWNLLDVPPGLTHDEASNAHDASGVLAGKHAIYFASGYGHEPLYVYSVALFTALTGESIWTLRYTSVIWSLLLLALTTALSRRWWGRRAAILTATAITTSFWGQMMGRVGLRAPVLPVLFTASVLCFDQATYRDRHQVRNFILSGICLGASFYTYMASRGLPLVFVFFVVVQLVMNRRLFGRIWRGTLLAITTALLTGAPLFMHLQRHPELELRVAQLGGALIKFFKGDPIPLIKNITNSLPLLLWRADPQWLYNSSGRAALEPLFAVFFVGGVAAALGKIKQPRNVFLLLWVGAGVAPALL